jgi:hypothetical protein
VRSWCSLRRHSEKVVREKSNIIIMILMISFFVYFFFYPVYPFVLFFIVEVVPLMHYKVP